MVDKIAIAGTMGQRLTDSVETALRFGNGIVVIAPEGEPHRVMSQQRACHHCGISFPEPTPQRGSAGGRVIAARRFVPSDDRPGTLDWSIQVGRRIRTLDDLRVLLRLRCGQFALLSSTATPRDSLGARFFTFTTKDGRTLQRVVLVQAEPSRAAVAARATAR